MVRVFRWWVRRQSKSFPLDAFILYALSNCQNLLACCSKFDHLVDGLLVSGEFPEQLSKKEVQLWIRETKAVNQGNIPTICWKPWSTNAVVSNASEFLSAQSNCLELTRWPWKLSLLHWSFLIRCSDWICLHEYLHIINLILHFDAAVCLLQTWICRLHEGWKTFHNGCW